ncbi:transmembrane protein, putative [Medicago truncatula]|uniref:Transmembrane protein, putative n=1 Tax=Medicago truncatula TaxID=3880 RepID=A0A072VJF7_MEDTR|nr:transmembrane protein, putative [Medicago truncatula]
MAETQFYKLIKRCCCCLMSKIWKLLVTIIILLGLIIIAFWLIVLPRAFNFSFEQTKLTQQFNNNNTLRYNLVLNTENNPNKKLSIYYNEVKGHMFYEGSTFASKDAITCVFASPALEKNVVDECST